MLELIKLMRGYLYTDFKSVEELWNHFKSKSGIYKDIIYLGDFNSDKIIKDFELLNLTNQFNILYGIKEIEFSEIDNAFTL